MSVLTKANGIPEDDLGQGTVKRVLVVDDSRAQRRILSVYLARWGYAVLEAASGAEALELCKTNEIDLIVSDWMMPGMTGLELCQAFRAQQRDHYGYFILLTSKSEKEDVAHGLDVGADDFLTKPVAANEFLARIRAGERILRMERELTEQNRLVSETLAEISALYDSLDRDLAEARNLQQSLVRERFRDFGAARVSLLLRPSGHVGGDLVGFFPITPDQIGTFAVDVSGHGVASALMTARLAAYLSGSSPDQNLALTRSDDGALLPRSPAKVAAHLNRLGLEDIETELYFTMMMGHFNMKTGIVTLSQCGHPNAVVQRADGSVEYCGDGGMPIGLIEDASWEDFTIQLHAGDRLLLLSDGITECPDPNDNMLEEDGLTRLLKRNARLQGNTFFETLIWDLTAYAGDKNFPDDVSAVLLEYDGPN
ncbi:MAG: PP2C family protein-serine/threonine phosphatase [Paracoccaceae bacterium]